MVGSTPTNSMGFSGSKNDQHLGLEIGENPTIFRSFPPYLCNYTFNHGNPKPSFLEVITPIYWGFKTFIFHGFGVQGKVVCNFHLCAFHDSNLYQSFTYLHFHLEVNKASCRTLGVRLAVWSGCFFCDHHMGVEPKIRGKPPKMIPVWCTPPTSDPWKYFGGPRFWVNEIKVSEICCCLDSNISAPSEPKIPTKGLQAHYHP